MEELNCSRLEDVSVSKILVKTLTEAADRLDKRISELSAKVDQEHTRLEMVNKELKKAERLRQAVRTSLAFIEENKGESL